MVGARGDTMKAISSATSEGVLGRPIRFADRYMSLPRAVA